MEAKKDIDLERFDRILRIRVLVSVVTFATFVAVALHGVLTGWHVDNPTPAVILLLVGFFAWPRRAWPRKWEPDPESSKERQEWKGRQIVQKKIDRVRLFYFAVAVVLLAILPFSLGQY